MVAWAQLGLIWWRYRYTLVLSIARLIGSATWVVHHATSVGNICFSSYYERYLKWCRPLRLAAECTYTTLHVKGATQIVDDVSLPRLTSLRVKLDEWSKQRHEDLVELAFRGAEEEEDEEDNTTIYEKEDDSEKEHTEVVIVNMAVFNKNTGEVHEHSLRKEWAQSRWCSSCACLYQVVEERSGGLLCHSCIDRRDEGGTDKERVVNMKTDEIRNARCTYIPGIQMND